MIVSEDGGRSFAEHFTPRGLIIDFEVDPGDPERIVAATDDQLFRSEDEGESWRPILPAEGVRLAWPQGRPALRRHQGRAGAACPATAATASRTSGRVDGEPYVFEIVSGDELYLALERRHDPAHRGRRALLRGGVPAVRRRALAGAAGLCLLAALAAGAGRSALARAPGGRGRVLPVGRRHLAQRPDRAPERQPHRVPRPQRRRRHGPGLLHARRAQPGRPGSSRPSVPPRACSGVRVDLGDREDSASIGGGDPHHRARRLGRRPRDGGATPPTS